MRSLIAGFSILICSAALAEWRYEASVDEFEGRAHHRILAESEAGSTPAVLSLGCEEDGHPAWRYLGDEVLDGRYSGSPIGGVETYLRLSVDGEPVTGALVTDWPRTESMVGASTAAHRAVTKKLLGGERLIVRTQAVVGRLNDAVFAIAGLEEALEQLDPFCKRI